MDGVGFSSPQELAKTKTRCSTRPTRTDKDFTIPNPPPHRTSASTLELIVATNPPFLESLLLQLPTASILQLYHTSRFLRSFLSSYPLAWTHLSFRLSTIGRSESRQASPASDASGETLTRCSKPYALDQLLLAIVVPLGTRLKSLVLDHTSVSGLALTQDVLPARGTTLEHLSVRGCKLVSLKYHLVPYLNLFSLQNSIPRLEDRRSVNHLALKSLYTFRCRHHRRRPYLQASLLRKEADGEATHELIKICHHLGIWTDTAWCPTPGGRCLRRKDYYNQRGTIDGRGEIWAVFDRLWRSGNTLGSSNGTQTNHKPSMAQLWETAEYGHEGEPLGCPEQGKGEGKMVPTHLRRSHRMFVENFTCHDCGDHIQERCEQCSVRMHCIGCRKTLCASCAFTKPLPRSKSKSDESDKEQGDLFWWAPGQTRNPNLMMQERSNDGVVGNLPNSVVTPTINMSWCCLKPMFSGGSGIVISGSGVTGPAADQIRSAPLPKGHGWEDTEFVRIRQDDGIPKDAHGRPDLPGLNLGEGGDSMLQWLLHGPGSQDNSICPRNLCQECWQTPGWKAACQACQEPFCFAHDLRGLKIRICGYRDLALEKAKTDAENRLECMRDLVALADTISQSPETTHDLAAWTSLPDTVDDDLAAESSSFVETDEGSESLPSLQPQDEAAHVLPESLPTPSIESSSTFDLPSSSEPSQRKWQGCAAFLCPEFRAMGDHRPKCTAAAKECTGCGVHVCPECLIANPPCDCSLCRERYHCPNCFRAKPAGSCKKVEEDKRKRADKLRERLLLEEALRIQRMADEGLGRLPDEIFEGVKYLFGSSDNDGEEQAPAVSSSAVDHPTPLLEY